MGVTQPAGDFREWLRSAEASIRDASTADVPCRGCTACCTSSQFVHIEPDEIDTVAHIPAELLFPAPRRPAGHVVLGYDERGHCPMLVDAKCSIYEHRPRTCRTYDCRVIAAAGIRLESAQQRIADRVAQWEFSHPDDADRAEHAAVEAAAGYLATHPGVLSDDAAPRSATRLAGLAVRIHRLFLDRDADPDPAAVEAALIAPGSS